MTGEGSDDKEPDRPTHQLPRKHHFVPQFYLSRWTAYRGNFGRTVVELQRPRENEPVKCQFKAPAATGYRLNLYPQDHPAHPSTNLELRFMSGADSLAAKALTRLESGEDPNKWSTAERSDWARYIMMAMFRMPRSVQGLSNYMSENWVKSDNEMRVGYEGLRQPDWPATLEEFLTQRKEEIFGQAEMEALHGIMDNPEIGGAIMSSRWSVLDLSDSRFELVTSDNPVSVTLPRMLIAMPIGPRMLFAAFREDRVLKSLLELDPTLLAREINLQTVAQAEKYVYSSTERCRNFVDRHLGKHRPYSAADRLLDALSEANSV